MPHKLNLSHSETINLSYFGQLSPNNQITTLELENITFRDNACYTYYGGGTGLWIVKVETVEFESCKFINNVALRSPLARYQRPDNKAFLTLFQTLTWSITNASFQRIK